MEFRILGSMEVMDGVRRVELPSGRGRSLLALLTLHVGEPVGVERLIDELWEEQPPATAATVVHGLVSRLRKVLERDGRKSTVVQTVGAAYRLTADPDDVDANRFTRLLDEARVAPPDARVTKLSAALALWRGPALADFIYEPFAQRAIAALEESKIQAIEDRFEAEIALGRDAQLVTGLHEAIAAHPYREGLRGHLMVALYRAGRQQEALDVYRDARDFLIEEMGLEPGPALRELEAAILRQDPDLVPRRATEGQQARSSADAPSWLPRERRTVTIAAVDIVPSVSGDLDAEAVAAVGAKALSVATDVLERHGARVERSLGDELIAFFGFPVAHEDDALRAVRAAFDVRLTLSSLDGEPSAVEGVAHRSRVGIETGDIIVAGPGAALRDVVTGPVVSGAARLEHAADDGDILVGPGAQRLLHGAVVVKPVDGGPGLPTRVWRVLEVVNREPAIPRAMDAPMVGRQNEYTQLRSAFKRAVRSGSVVRVTVVGEAGIGKSRLAKEVVASIGKAARAVTLRCSSPRDALGFYPVRQTVVEGAGLYGWRGMHELLTAAYGEDGTVREISEATKLRSPPASVSELVVPMRRLLDAFALKDPLVVVLDDLHWADTVFLETVDRLERELTGRVLLFCLARPELTEDAAPAGEVVMLEPLQASEIASLVIGRSGPTAQTSLQRIINLAQGNPLFAEQLLAAVDDGDVDAIPASLVGLLSMRLDRLGPGERDLLRCASVAGLDVDLDLIVALLPDEARPFVERHVSTLERKRLIERVGAGRFRFAHALIQMAAYQSMTREDRARLHEGAAERLDRERPDATAASPEDHLRQAVEHRRAIGARD